jgi:hypothetical protein
MKIKWPEYTKLVKNQINPLVKKSKQPSGVPPVDASTNPHKVESAITNTENSSPAPEDTRVEKALISKESEVTLTLKNLFQFINEAKAFRFIGTKNSSQQATTNQSDTTIPHRDAPKNQNEIDLINCILYALFCEKNKLDTYVELKKGIQQAQKLTRIALGNSTTVPQQIINSILNKISAKPNQMHDTPRGNGSNNDENHNGNDTTFDEIYKAMINLTQKLPNPPPTNHPSSWLNGIFNIFSLRSLCITDDSDSKNIEGILETISQKIISEFQAIIENTGPQDINNIPVDRINKTMELIEQYKNIQQQPGRQKLLGIFFDLTGATLTLPSQPGTESAIRSVFGDAKISVEKSEHNSIIKITNLNVSPEIFYTNINNALKNYSPRFTDGRKSPPIEIPVAQVTSDYVSDNENIPPLITDCLDEARTPNLLTVGF